MPCKGRELSHTSAVTWEAQSLPTELGDLLEEISKQVLKVPLGFLLPQKERYTLSKGWLNKRNQDLRAVRCLASPEGTNVNIRNGF